MSEDSPDPQLPESPEANLSNANDGCVKTRRRRQNPAQYDDDVSPTSTKLRRIKGTILASNKPSYCFKLGIGSSSYGVGEVGETLRSKHRKRLRKLLRKLVKQHNWVEASGVLSALLQATPKDKSVHYNRLKYWATLELVKRIEDGNINSNKFRKIYELWMTKNGSMGNWALKDRCAAKLEFILFLLSQGNVEDENLLVNVTSLMQEHGFDRDPISNFVVGLAFYELWYSGLPEEWQLTDFNKHSGLLESETTETTMSMSIENYDGYDGYDGVESLADYFPLQTNSITSVANDKDVMEVEFDHHKEVSLDVDNNLQGHTPNRSLSLEDFHVYSAEGSGDEKSSPVHVSDLPYTSIFSRHGLPSWLLPLRLPHSIDDNLEEILDKHKRLKNGHYQSAVKHLQLALQSTPPVIEALHPLIQMLLLGDDVINALEELKKLENRCHDSGGVLKLRLEAGLIEHFDPSNFPKLSACYEDILEADPTCGHSLARLINMHQRGDYSTEKLVKMIALHLDASYAEGNMWKEFAAGLLRLSQCAGDQMSVCNFNGGEDESDQGYSAHVNQIPQLFTCTCSRDDWRLRCKWWLNRHFSPRILASEISAGDLELLAWKAASATFLYGRDFKYVVKAMELLEKENKDLCSELRIHVDNSVGFYDSK